MVVAATEAGKHGLFLSIRYLVVYLYDNNGLIASTQLERLHRAFDILTDLFDRVGLRENTRKMVIMACQKCYTPERILVAVYERRTTVIGPKNWKRQRMRAQCLYCGVEVTAGPFLTHRHSQHGVGRGYRGGHPPPPHPYRVVPDILGLLPKTLLRLQCLVSGCLDSSVKLVQPPGSLFAPPCA